MTVRRRFWPFGRHGLCFAISRSAGEEATEEQQIQPLSLEAEGQCRGAPAMKTEQSLTERDAQLPFFRKGFCQVGQSLGADILRSLWAFWRLSAFCPSVSPHLHS